MPKKVKNTTFPGLLDLIAPHSCRGCGQLGSALCNRCKKHIICCNFNKCPICKKPINKAHRCKHCHDLPPTFIMGIREGLLSNLIHDYKYYSIRAIGTKLAECLHENIPKEAFPKNSVLVPLPTATNHIRSRGFDHTLLIAKHFAKYRHLKLQKLLLRNKNTVQVGADKSTRLTQASSAYTINNNTELDPTVTYILFDDVWTTGASMMSAVQKLRSAGAKKINILLLSISILG